MSVSPDKQLIPCNDKRKKTQETLIKGRESIQEKDNTVKGENEFIISDGKRHKRTLPPFKNMEDYISGKNEKTLESDDSSSENDGCARNHGKEHKY